MFYEDTIKLNENEKFSTPHKEKMNSYRILQKSKNFKSQVNIVTNAFNVNNEVANSINFQSNFIIKKQQKEKSTCPSSRKSSSNTLSNQLLPHISKTTETQKNSNFTLKSSKNLKISNYLNTEEYSNIAQSNFTSNSTKYLKNLHNSANPTKFKTTSTIKFNSGTNISHKSLFKDKETNSSRNNNCYSKLSKFKSQLLIPIIK